MIHFITFGDSGFAETKKRLLSQAESLGWFDTATAYGTEDLDDDFKERFKSILTMPRGGGYWIWKPYIIHKHLEKIKDGDILIYLDAGCYINPNGYKRFKEYIEMLNADESGDSGDSEGCISFQMSHHTEDKWTTKEIFEHFNIHEDSRDIIESGQFIATVRMFKKNANSMNIVSAWRNALYQNPLLFTDYYNDANAADAVVFNNFNKNKFIENRHDQSVLSVVCKLYKTIVLDDETYFAEGFGSEASLRYPFWKTTLRY
jgi:hypothetical protein